MDNPLVIVFVVSIVLIAIYMAIEGFVLAYNVGSRVWGKTGKDDKDVPPPAPPPAPAVVAQTPPSAGNVLQAMASCKPHLLVVGHTGGGKSVLTRAFVKHLVDSGAKVISLDPDAAPRHYPAEVQLINDDKQWARAILAIADEFGKRNEAYRDGKETFDPLWIAADECQELLALDNVLETIERLIRRGRKLNIHVCLAVQDSQVKTLGLERKSALLANLSHVEVMKRDDARIALVDGKEYAVPDLPTTYNGAAGTVLDLQAAPAPATIRWTDKHEQASAILTDEPGISGRKLALALYGHETGESFYLTKKIRDEVEAR